MGRNGYGRYQDDGYYDHYAPQDYDGYRPWYKSPLMVVPVGIAALIGFRIYNSSQEDTGGLNRNPAGVTTTVPNAGGFGPFPGGLMCSPEKSQVVVDDRSIVDGNYSLYRAINVNFGEESEIGIDGGVPIQGTDTEAFVL